MISLKNALMGYSHCDRIVRKNFFFVAHELDEYQEEKSMVSKFASEASFLFIYKDSCYYYYYYCYLFSLGTRHSQSCLTRPNN